MTDENNSVNCGSESKTPQVVFSSVFPIKLIKLVVKTIIVTVVFVYTVAVIEYVNDSLIIINKPKQTIVAKQEGSYEQLKTLLKECIGVKPDPTPVPTPVPQKTSYEKLKELLGID